MPDSYCTYRFKKTENLSCFFNSNPGFVPHQVNFPGEDPMATVAPPAGPAAAASLENGGNKPARKIKRKVVPKIYFGTR